MDTPENIARDMQTRYACIDYTAPTDAIRDARRALVDRIMCKDGKLPLIGQELEQMLKAAEAEFQCGHIWYLTSHSRCVPKGRM